MMINRLTLAEKFDSIKLLKLKTTPTIVQVLQEKYGLESHTTQQDLFNNINIILNNIDKNGKINITYERKDRGRMYVTKMNDINYSGGLVKMFRPIRHYLTNQEYIDIDMVNGQPSVFLSLIENMNHKAPYIKELVLEREGVFNSINSFYGFSLSREEIKKLLIRLFNGGSYDYWLEEKGFTEKMDFIHNLSKEIKNITKILFKENLNLVDESKKLSSNIAKIYQHYECNIVLELYHFLNNHGLADICSLQYDGIQILKNDSIGILLDQFNDYIKKDFKYVTFKIKDLNMDITDKDFDKAQELLAKELCFVDYKNLENYLFGEKIEDYKMVKNTKTLIESKEISKYSVNFLKKWYFFNIKYIDNDSNPYFLVRNRDIRSSNITWRPVVEEKLSLKVEINAYFRNISVHEELKDRFNKITTENIKIYNNKTFKDLYLYFMLKNNRDIVDSYAAEGFIPYNKNKIDKKNMFNIFDGFYFKTYKPKKHVAFEGSLFHKHLLKYTCNGCEESYKYLIGWIAQLIQYPEKKHRACLVQYGIEGTGKDTLITFIQRMIGINHVLRTSKIEDLTTKTFNSFNYGKLLIGLNEIKEKNNDSNRNYLKDIVDKETEIIERKYVAPFASECFKRFIFNTNDRNAFKIVEGNSRYFMLSTSPEMARNKEYFSKIKEEFLDDDYIKSAFDYFDNLDISDFNVFHFPVTKYAMEQQINSLSSPLKYLLSLFDDEEYNPDRCIDGKNNIALYTYDSIDDVPESKKLDFIEYTPEDLYREYTIFCVSSGFLKLNKTNFTDEILKSTALEKKKYRGKSNYYFNKNKYYFQITKDNTYNLLFKNVKI